MSTLVNFKNIVRTKRYQMLISCPEQDQKKFLPPQESFKMAPLSLHPPPHPLAVPLDAWLLERAFRKDLAEKK